MSLLLQNGRSLNIDEGVFDTMPKVNYNDVKVKRDRGVLGTYLEIIIEVFVY